LVVAETLIHEASHLKFFLVEDVAPMVEAPDPPRFEVPWRSDRRPLRAVLMGLHAWVRILAWLDTLGGSQYAQAAAERSTLLSEATTAAAEIVRGAEGLTPAGEALVQALHQRVRDR
jgi:HEXXH motif-containing protein